MPDFVMSIDRSRLGFIHSYTEEAVELPNCCYGGCFLIPDIQRFPVNATTSLVAGLMWDSLEVGEPRSSLQIAHRERPSSGDGEE
jgi:hypothetical protein